MRIVCATFGRSSSYNIAIVTRYLSAFSAVFSDFASTLQDLSAARGLTEFLVSDTGQIFKKKFLAQNYALWSSLSLTHE